MKWKIEKKHIIPAVPVLVIILLSLLFNNLLQEGTKYKNIGDTVKNTFSPIFWGFILAYLLNPIMKKLEKFVFMPLAKRIYRKKDAQAKQKKLSRVLGVIFTFAVFPFSVTAVIVVVPFFFASTKPSWVTVATFLLLVFQVKVVCAVDGDTVAFSWSVLPFFSFTVPDLFNLTFVGTEGSITVTLQVAFLPL